MSVQQGTPIERNLFLSSAGVPSLGISFANVVCQIRKEGDVSLTTKTLTINDWNELGNGYYIIRFSAADMSNVGYFFYTLTSNYFDNLAYDEFKIDPIYQSVAIERNILLTLNDIPSTGVLYTDVACRYRKAGDLSLTNRALTVNDWDELGNGFYVIRFSAGFMTNVGFFFYTLTSPKFDNFNYDEFSIEPVPPETILSNTCTVSGSVLNVGGSVSKHTRVLMRPILFPGTFAGNMINADVIWTYVNSNGTFQLDVLQGSTVIVEIENTGIRAQITIPLTTAANLTDLLPPFPINS